MYALIIFPGGRSSVKGATSPASSNALADIIPIPLSETVHVSV